MTKGDKKKFGFKKDSKIKKEVSNKIFAPVINAINQKGLPFKDFLDGIPYDDSYFLNKRERVEWWVYCKILSNMRTHFSLQDFENIGADFFRGGNFIEGLIGFFLLTSKKFSRQLTSKIFKRITSHVLAVNMQIEFIGNNKIKFTIQVNDEYEHSKEFAHGNRGVIRELGIRAGLKDCKVDLQFIPQGAVYEMSWRKEGFFFELKRRILWLFNINKAFWELTDTNEELLKEYEKLEDYKNNLEIKVDERTAELKKAHNQLSETIDLLKETQQLQNRFFSNISHEFRTPLTLILGPVKKIIERTKEEKTRDDLRVVHENANRLLRLVNQLLDISKLESGNMKLQASPQNIVPLFKALLQSFSSYAERKSITLKFNSFEDEIIVFIDKDKIEKIITNVLSNAFKFTPEGGEVEATLTRSFSSSTVQSNSELVSGSSTKPKMLKLVQHDNGNFVEISIHDTGIGIPQKKLPRIFDRFYQVDGSHTREHVVHPDFTGEGTGIGLSLTKELVELHKGKIEVESEEGKGTTFTISIPLGKEHLRPEEICEQSLSQIPPSRDFLEEIIFPAETKTKKHDIDLITETNKPLLLIVEDNSDVRNYLKSNLDKDYKILEAVDGEDGWNKSVEQIPDLIVSDVMMPKMDGFKLCDKLKTDERTSHIPLILLTAKASTQDKIEGFETGADDYIMKPFEPDELKARIRNLIEQRERLHEYFKKQGLFELEKLDFTSVDQKFLQKVFDEITRHISNSSLNVEFLVENLGISRSVLQRKILSLVGETPGELIRRIRLKKAANLIEQKFGNISEIALEVGFSNPAYFSECFKKQFGCNPSQYKL